MPETLRVPAPEGVPAWALSSDVDSLLDAKALTARDACVIGIDPGLKGGVAILYASAPDRVITLDMPLAGNEVDPHALKRIIQTYGPTIGIVERVASRPTDSRPSAFSFGGSYYTARTVLALSHVPIHLVTPQVWKKHYKLTGAEDPKEAARALAIQLFPSCAADQFARKRDHGRADAALLAKFAAVTFNG